MSAMLLATMEPFCFKGNKINAQSQSCLFLDTQPAFFFVVWKNKYLSKTYYLSLVHVIWTIFQQFDYLQNL